MKVKLSQFRENWKNFRNQGIVNMCVCVLIFVYITNYKIYLLSEIILKTSASEINFILIVL